MTADVLRATLSPPRAALADWLMAMEHIAEEDGYLEPLGTDHWAFFAEAGPQLVVTFCKANEVRADASYLPLGYECARAHGWSYLCLIAEGDTFWRAPEVWGYIDRLIDDGFFEDFDHVLFTGEGESGYAAASYMVAAPGARGLLFAPRATLSPSVASWDKRHLSARRLDFTSRYGYAPDMTEGANRVWVIYDPQDPADAAHAALFRAPWVTLLPLRHAGPAPRASLRACDLYIDLVEQAVRGHISRDRLYQGWRKRKDSAPYLRNLLAAAHARAKARSPAAPDYRLPIAVCRAALAKGKGQSFARYLTQIGVKTP